MKNYLIIPHLRIQEANAFSGAYITGLPAIPAFLGTIHALQRKINAEPKFRDVIFKKVGIVAHKCTPLSRRINYTSALILPKKTKPKEASSESFSPEGRINLEISLIIETNKIDGDLYDELIQSVTNELMRIRVAGGTVLNLPKVHFVITETQREEKKILCSLLPGYALIERRDILLKNPQAKDNLQTLLTNLATLTPNCRLVPIVTGYKQISEFVECRNQRDYSLPHFFAESVVTLGEYCMPYRFNTIDELMWRYEIKKEQGLYLCINQ